jgi:uncharacterized protein (UPF0548 family)
MLAGRRFLMPKDMKDIATLSLTYDLVGATAGRLPEGYQHIQLSSALGRGRDCFEKASAAVMRWGMQRGAGLTVESSTTAAEVGSEVVIRFGPLAMPCRVVYVIDEPDTRGFAYGTLQGHAESGEERFAVRYDPASNVVYADVVAFSRPGTWWSKAAAPVASLAQRIITKRYLRALRDESDR